MLGHIATTCLTFQGTVKLFPKWPHHFSFSSAMYKGSTSSTKPVLSIFFFFFDSSHPSGCDVVLLCVILMTNDGECLFMCLLTVCGLPWCLSGKQSACQCRRHGLNSWVGKIPWGRKWQPTPVFLPEKSHR